MKKPVSFPLLFGISSILFLLGFGLPRAAARPVEREVFGTHSGSEAKPPFNMALVPAGKVQMGMEPDEALKLAQGQKGFLDIFSRSVPKNSVYVDHDYFCDLYEVTNAQWKVYLDRTEKEPSKYLVNFAWKKNKTYPSGEALFPVRNVTLYEARAFARWCGKRIPTEEEWHRAAAGDDGRIYAWGNEWDPKKCTNRRHTLAPVGSYEAGKSPFGIYDMTAGVWEWTNTRFDAFKGYKPLKVKMGNKWASSNPKFNPAEYVTKGGCYFLGPVANRLDIREPSLPENSLDTLGFRCVKDVRPGKTLLAYALLDLKGSVISDRELDERNLYAMELMEYTDTEPKVIQAYKGLAICPMGRALTTIAKIKTESPDTPFPMAVLTVNLSLESPNLPAGSYVLAFRHKGLSKEDKKAALAKAKAKKRAPTGGEKGTEGKAGPEGPGGGKKPGEKGEPQAKKEGKGKEEGKAEQGKKAGPPKTPEEIEAERKRKEEEERLRKEREREEAERKAAEEAQRRLGLIAERKHHIEFPRDKDLVVFMNANDTIVGYVEVEAFQEEMAPVPIQVVHSPEDGLTHVNLSVKVLGGKYAHFTFSMKIKDNPF